MITRCRLRSISTTLVTVRLVADHHHGCRRAGDEPLQQSEPLGVEVVGGLVEQVDVVPGQQQRRETDPGRLAAGQRGHLQVELDVEPEVLRHDVAACLEVRSTEGRPVLQGLGEGVVGAWAAVRQGMRRDVQVVVRGRDPGPPPEMGRHGLAGQPLELLGEEADVGVRRRHPYGAGVGGTQTGQDAQQGGLAGAVRPDQADDVARGDDEVRPAEQLAVAEARTHTLGLHGRGHGGHPRPSRARSAHALPRDRVGRMPEAPRRG
jgi:hypothetical protein